MGSTVFLRTTCPVSPDPEVLFLRSRPSLSLFPRENVGPALWRIWVLLWRPVRVARLAGAQRQDPIALCSVGHAARTRARVNGLSKDNFCFSFAVWSCPAASNEKCAFSRDSGAGDLCGNRPHSRGLGCSAGPRGCRAGAAWKRTWCPGPSSAHINGALLHPYLQDILQPLTQEAERFIAVK